MLGVLLKWVAEVEECSTPPSPEGIIIEAQDGEWLLIDLELVDNNTNLLKEYVVVPESCLLPCAISEEFINGAKQTINTKQREVFRTTCTAWNNREKFRGKIKERFKPREHARPYYIPRPLKSTFLFKMPASVREQKSPRAHGMFSPTDTAGIIPTVGSPTKSFAAHVPGIVSQSNHVGIYSATVDPTKLQQAPIIIEDFHYAIVQYEPSPLQRLLHEVADIKQNQRFETVLRLDICDRLPADMVINKTHRDSSERLRIKDGCYVSVQDFEWPHSLESCVIYLQPKPLRQPLLALEWKDSQPEATWYERPVMSLFSDFCQRTTQLKQHVPQATLLLRVLWTQFLQLLTFGRDLLCCNQGGEHRTPINLQAAPSRRRYLMTHDEAFCEGKSRAAMERKTKRHDTRKRLKRAYGAQSQKYLSDNNRGRAMEFNRFKRAAGRRGC